MINYEERNGVAIITFDRAPANAYNTAFQQTFGAAIDRANSTDSVVAVVIKSTSPKFFCSGADIKEFSANSTEQNQKMVKQARQNLAAMENSSKIYIAGIQGHTLGGGLEIAMACDIRIAMIGNYLFGLPEIKLGLIPGNGGTQRLTKLVGLSIALDLLITGNTISSSEAHRIGLVSRLIHPDEFDMYLRSYSELIASGASLALGATKKAVRAAADLPLNKGLEIEKQLSDQLYDTRDANEGFNAFIEKRIPLFTGK